MLDCELDQLQDVYRERSPYTIMESTSGSVFVFNYSYITLLREALTNGCMVNMSTAEKNMTYGFISYQNGGDATPALVALDKWMVNLVDCIDNPSLADCESAGFTFNTCGA